MRLEDIGFYTLLDERAKQASVDSPMWRCELILTSRCNFSCPYCRPMRRDCRGDMSIEQAGATVGLWVEHGLKNVRFSGGEPMLYPWLRNLVEGCQRGGVERIAVSTNGSATLDNYMDLIDSGVNDFSFSLDGCCSADVKKMSGGRGDIKRIARNIEVISSRAYTTAGIVITEDNIKEAMATVMFAYELGVSDIRVIPSAQYNKALLALSDLPDEVLMKFPILDYRVKNIAAGSHVRGIPDGNHDRCRLMLDDMAVAGKWHFPCIIYFREGGEPIGRVGPRMRTERAEFVEKHEPWNDPICKRNCLDVCIDYNRKAAQ